MYYKMFIIFTGMQTYIYTEKYTYIKKSLQNELPLEQTFY